MKKSSLHFYSNSKSFSTFTRILSNNQFNTNICLKRCSRITTARFTSDSKKSPPPTQGNNNNNKSKSILDKLKQFTVSNAEEKFGQSDEYGAKFAKAKKQLESFGKPTTSDNRNQPPNNNNNNNNDNIDKNNFKKFGDNNDKNAFTNDVGEEQTNENQVQGLATLLIDESERFVQKNQDLAQPFSLMTGKSTRGFQINKVGCYGGAILLPRFYALWNCAELEHVTIDSLKLITLYNPKIEILFVGTGERPRRLNESLVKELKSFGIRVEAMTSRSAGASFNFANQDGRDVAAALLPEVACLASDAILENKDF